MTSLAGRDRCEFDVQSRESVIRAEGAKHGLGPSRQLPVLTRSEWDAKSDVRRQTCPGAALWCFLYAASLLILSLLIDISADYLDG